MKNGLIIDNNGSKFWYLNDKKHREDGPAEEYANGSKHWWLNGKRHREDGPASELANGNKYWYLNNKRHREDGPAQEFAFGYEQWWLNGERMLVSYDPATPCLRWWKRPINARGFGLGESSFVNSTDGTTWLVDLDDFTTGERTMEEWILELNTNEEYSYQWINDIEGLFGLIKNPSGRQRRLHQMKWVL